MSPLTLPGTDVFRLSSRARGPIPAFPLGLGESGVHEVCEAAHGDFPALTGFAFTARAARKGAIAWVRQGSLMREHGHILQTGIPELSRERHAILDVTARKPGEALWATEEAIRSAAVGLVVAELEDADFTATRRLALASSRHGVPVILLMPYARNGSTAATARWRVSARPSAPNRYDPHAPGALRWKAVLERSRQAPHMAGHSFNLELDDETLSLRVASGLAADPPAPRPARTGNRLGPSGIRQTA